MAHKLLLADDSVTIQRVIELTFADEDVQVIAVGDGKQAMERVQADRPDIVLADVGMPEHDGYEVAAFIKSNPQLSHIPVLLLTGAFEPIDETRARSVGCDGVLVKPFEPQMVISRVRDLLSGRRPAGLWAQTPAAQTPVRPPAPPAPDMSQAAPVAPAETPGDSLDDYFDRLDAAFSNVAAPSGLETPQLKPAPEAVEPPVPALAPVVFQEAPTPPPAPAAFREATVAPPAFHEPPPEPPAFREAPPPPAPATLREAPPPPAPAAFHEAPWPPPAAFREATPPPAPAAFHEPPPPAPAVSSLVDDLATWDPELTGDPARPPGASMPPPFAQAVRTDESVWEIPAQEPREPPPSSAAPAIPAAAPMPPAAALPRLPAVAPPGAPAASSTASAAPVVATPAPAAGAEMPSLAEAFAALLAAEQNKPISPSAFAAIPEETLDEIARRVLDHMSPDKVRRTLVEVAERLVREEIERIKAR